jgi:hypothetical protein
MMVECNQKQKKRINIYIRKKPLLEKINNQHYDICTIINNKTLQIKKNSKRVDLQNTTKYIEYKADYIFNDNHDNDYLFNKIVKPIIKLKNNILFFTYGQSGSGKTYTLLGKKGIIYKTCKDILKYTTISISCFEIYKDNIYDLYDKKLIKFYEKDKIINVIGLKNKKIDNEENLEKLLNIYTFNRKNGKSSHNENSSRSHAIYKIIYIYNNIKYIFQFIDLAGSERAVNAKINNVNDNSHINKSLLSLKECIRKYMNNSNYIPFRTNKLTLYLRNYFILDSHFIMLSTISSCNKNIIDTEDTLKYTNYMNKISNKKYENNNYLKNLENKDQKNILDTNTFLEIKKINLDENKFKYGNNIIDNISKNISKNIFKENNEIKYKKLEFNKKKNDNHVFSNIPIIKNSNIQYILNKTNKKEYIVPKININDQKKLPTILNKIENKEKKNKTKNNFSITKYIKKRNSILIKENKLIENKSRNKNFYVKFTKILNDKINLIDNTCIELKNNVQNISKS